MTLRCSPGEPEVRVACRWSFNPVREPLRGLGARRRLPLAVSHGTRGDTPAAGSVLIATTPDGRYSVLASTSSAFSAGVTDHNDAYDVFEWDRTTGSSTLVSHSATSLTVTGDGLSYPYAISDDGRYVLFDSQASNLVASQVDNNAAASDVFLWDRNTGMSTLVSHTAAAPATTGSGGSGSGCMSGDGSYVIFESYATDLVSGQVDANAAFDVFEWSRTTNATTLISHVAASTTTTAAGNSYAADIPGTQTVSADGRYVAFESDATNLLSITDTNGNPDVFLWDRDSAVAGALTLISHQLGSNTTATTSVSPGSRPHGISADGSTVIFRSGGSDLVAGDGNVNTDAFAWTRTTNTNTLISHAAGSSASSNGGSFPVSVSSTGRYVTFTSVSTNLVSGAVDSNGNSDAYLWDRDASGLVTFISHIPSSATTAGDNESRASSITADGAYATVLSHASNLVSPSTTPIGT